MKSRRTVRLCVEELEGRVVPSTISMWNSTNWSGYALASSTSGAVSDVKGSWKVPQVTGSAGETSYSSTWIGIDGFNSSTVEQIGTDSDISNGVPTYYAWVEMYPRYPVNLNLPVNPGDSISAEVSYGSYYYGGYHYNFELTINNNTANQGVVVLAYMGNAKRNSAEWIQEAPSSNTGVLPLSNFGTVSFTGAQATINGKTGAFDHNFNTSRSTVTINAINMVSSSGTTEATTQVPFVDSVNASGTVTSGFTVTYGSPTASSTLKTTSKHNGTFDGMSGQVIAVASAADLSIAQMVVGSTSSTSNAATLPNNVVSSMNPSVQGIANPTALQPQNLAAFFAGSGANLGVPGTQGSDGMGAFADKWTQSPGVRWFAPMTPAEQPAAPPADSKNDADTPAEMSRLDVSPESSAAIDSLAGAMADPGPIFGADIPADQSAAAFALLAVAFYSRPFLVKTDKESRNRRPELDG